MRYIITQAELCEAVQLYLNQVVLARPVTIAKVERLDSSYGIDLREVAAEDDQGQVDSAAREAAGGQS